MAQPKTIGIFAGLMTSTGKLRLQRRIEQGSIIPGKSYEGDYELPGGRVGEKDLKKALTLEVLKNELILRVERDLGIAVRPHILPPVYLAVFEDRAKDICDWAFMMPVPPPPFYWDENAPTARTTVDVNPQELYDLAQRPKGEQLLSGWGKRMCRLSLGALLNSSSSDYQLEARKYLDEIRPDWQITEYFGTFDWVLTHFEKELGFR